VASSPGVTPRWAAPAVLDHGRPRPAIRTPTCSGCRAAPIGVSGVDASPQLGEPTYAFLIASSGHPVDDGVHAAHPPVEVQTVQQALAAITAGGECGYRLAAERGYQRDEIHGWIAD
jgi:hypothetical protein